MSILIKNGVVTGPSGQEQSDILIKDGQIAQIGRGLSAETQIDAAGLHVLPGLFDLHCHLREPGYEYKETIASGCRSAAAGGFTSVCCMANTNPVNDDKTVTSYILQKAADAGLCRVYPIAAVSKGLLGAELSEMAALKAEGAVAVSDDGRPVVNPRFMSNALRYASMCGLPLISHCEVPELAEGSLNEGELCVRMGLSPISPLSETLMAVRDMLLAEHLGVPVHIAHVSAAETVRQIAAAKKRGVRVTCETAPHYFSLTEQAADGFNTNAKVNPPLKTPRDVKAVIDGLKDGTIDCIATDHAPHHADEKDLEFERAANGLVGFETAFSVGYTYLVKPGHLTLSALLDKMSLAPARIVNRPGGILAAGQPADLFLADLSAEWTVDKNSLLSKSKNTPFDGFTLSGRVKRTILSGKTVYMEEG